MSNFMLRYSIIRKNCIFTEDIEEILGQPCIRCPQHKYVISIETGESFYRPVEVVHEEERGRIRRKVVLLDWKSKGICQRTHELKVENGKVYVKLNDSTEELASDKYAFL
ncbi:uncharacterized protein TA21320 [Theileria annulata]|uniref:Hypothetical potein, conserved n=1 Tax=Theileria annulata TaxID=5874 RepID=Q4UGP3_THEAN|nr:uncharacterized protein TA21320 [Theileria annulata]CAI73746.1 hypothetical potein, conserved [Theileria annulata]|eukprot:XP_954423.1 hypothetical potein, conserved [Theileria annulata]